MPFVLQVAINQSIGQIEILTYLWRYKKSQRITRVIAIFPEENMNASIKFLAIFVKLYHSKPQMSTSWCL